MMYNNWRSQSAEKKNNPALSEQYTDVHLMSWVTSSMQAIFRLGGWDKDKFKVSAWARIHFFEDILTYWDTSDILNKILL